MPTPVRTRLALVILVWVALWPLAHRVLVARLDLNPWKLGGFAMYAAPAPPVVVVLLAPVGGELRPLEESLLPASVRDEINRFRLRRHALGAMTKPRRMARAVLESEPELPGLVVLVQRMRLDPETARMTSRRDRYVYDRSDD